MAGPNKRVVKKEKTKKKSPKAVKKVKQRASNRAPKRISLTNSLPTTQSYYEESMAYKVGFTELQPYAWITLRGDEKREALFFSNKSSPNELGQIIPTRHGLKSMKLTNEVGKYPKVEFSLYIPGYRKLQVNMTIGGEHLESHPGRAIEKFKIGAYFDVKWGFYGSHTRWKNLRVVQRKISFEEGTALLKVVGVIGSRLLATTSSEVFTNTYGWSAVDQITSLLGLSFDKTELLEEELEALEDDGRFIATAGRDMGMAVWEAAKKIDVDLYFNPELDSFRFSTPFKYELIKRGSKPLKMVYGYPTSMITSIDVETKFPKKRGTAVKGNGKDNDQEVSGENEVGKQEVSVTIVGIITKNGVQTIVGNSVALAQSYPKWAFRGNKNEALKQAKEVWKGYIVTPVVPKNVPTLNNVHYFTIKKKFVMDKPIVQIRTKDYSITEYNRILRTEVMTNKAILIPNEIKDTSTTSDNGIVTTKVVINAQYYTLPKESKEPKENTKQDTEPNTTTVTAENVSGDTTEGSETKDEYIWKTAIYDKALPPTYITDLGRKNHNDTENYLKRLEKEARRRGETWQVNKSETDTQYFLRLQEKVKVRSDPTTPNSSNEEENTKSESSSEDTTPTFTPAVKSAPRGKRALTTVGIKLKAGDWTMRVGKLIEIIDLYKSIDGYYSISKEEHVISASGFNTNFECVKASPKSVNHYGKTSIKSKGSKGNPEKGKGTRKPKGEEGPKPVQVIDLDARDARDAKEAKEAKVLKDREAAAIKKKKEGPSKRVPVPF